MKKIKILILTIITLGVTGCFNEDSMENITISTSVYPIQYVVNTLYGEHSNIFSIYPSDSEIIDFEVTDVLLEQYSSNDLFIFNGLSNEKNYVKSMAKGNENLKIIDVTSNMNINHTMEELWLDPNNLLTIANNIRKGLNEYIKSTYLTNEINENYENLKIDLTNLDGSYYSTVKNSSNNNIIVTDDAFLYLEKYGIKVTSLDPDTVTSKEINNAKELILNNNCDYIYIKYGEELNSTVNEILNETSAKTIELYTMTNLYNISVEKNNYLALMNQNLDSLKLELYK